MPTNVKQGSARRSPTKKKTTAASKTGKPGPKKGYKRSPESIAKAIATRKANAKKGGKPAARKTSSPRGPRGQVTFKLYAVDGNELAYLVDARGRVGDEVGTIHQAVASGQVSAGVPIVAVSAAPVVIQAIPQDPIFVVAGAPTHRGRRTSSPSTTAKKPRSTGGKGKPGPKPGYKRSPESIAKAKATRAANAKKKAKAAGGTAPKRAPAAAKAQETRPAPPTPPPVPAVSGNPFAE